MRYIGTDDLSPAVSAEEFRRATHLKEGEGADETAVEELLEAAQDVVIRATGLPLPGEYEFEVPMTSCWQKWFFPCRPVEGITALAVMNGDGAWADIDVADWCLVGGYCEPVLVAPHAGLPVSVSDRLRVQATVGSAALPSVRRSIIRLAKEWLDSDTAIEGDQMAPRMSFGALRLIKQVRYRRVVEFA